MSGIFNVNKSIRRAICYKCLYARCLSTKQNPSESSYEEVTKRRYVKPVKSRKSKPFKGSILNNIFGGKFDTKLFEYPSVLEEQDVNSVLQHSVEIENLLNSYSECKITKDILRDLQKVEAFGLTLPQEYGGSGYSKTEATFLEECMGVKPQIARFLGYNNFASDMLIRYGTEEQKQKYLPKIASGEYITSFAYLENGPLIDISSFEGTVIRDSIKNGYCIDTKKNWVHNADLADLFFVLALAPHLEENMVNQNVFIVDRNSPGLKIHALNSKAANEFGLYEVQFDNVFVEDNRLLGNPLTCGHSMLKSAFSGNALFDAVQCLCLMKRMIHSLTCDLTGEKYMQGKQPLRDFEYVKANVVHLTVWTYVLESVIYYVTGRYDMFEDPDLFHECAFAKILAIDFLQLCIDKYVQVVGAECFKSPGILEEALKILHYYSVFDEKRDYLKLMIGGDSVVIAASPATKKVKAVRDGMNHPWEALKWSLKGLKNREKEKEMKYNLKLDLHLSLNKEGDILESNLARLETTLEDFFIERGRDAIKLESQLMKIGEIATYIYALTACLARASTFYCNDFENAKEELNMTHIFGDMANEKIDKLLHELMRNNMFTYYTNEVGKLTFNSKMYPAAHPLTRTY